MTEEDQGGLGPLGLMELHGGSEIQVADAVSADDQEVLSLQEGGAGPHAAGGAQRGLLDEVVQADPPLLSVPEIGLHCLRHVAPVSYTHLDVYKRQGQACPCGRERREQLRLLPARAGESGSGQHLL